MVSFRQPVSVAEVRALLNEAGIAEPQVRHYGSTTELQIRTVDSDIDQLASRTGQALKSGLLGNPAQIIKTDLIGPTFADDMRQASRIATVLSLVVISLYIFVRFQNLSFTVVVLATLIHDVIIILGIFTLLNGVLPFNMDIDQVLIGAFLTIIGYSLNDTIVVFDRIRENKKLKPNTSWPEMVNRSINQTLSRTVVTSLTTFLVVAVLFVFGGAVLKGFAFAMMTGIMLGTYSTIFISCPMLVDMKKPTSQFVAVAKQ
ncbi:MAG: protein translocase subunit SecF [Balneolaceae bacterium]|nr:protein translocase subunit SecF [Balneolaceae bacterium]